MKKLAPTLRSALTLLIVVGALVIIWRSHLDPSRAGLAVTMVIAVITAIYAALTYEILRQNQAMADAAARSATMMEQNLRFSYAANLIFATVLVKDPSLNDRERCSVLDGEENRKAVADVAGAGPQSEFVFAIVRNIGRGPATKIKFETSYRVKDNANPNKTYLIEKGGNLTLLESDREIALLIYICKTPTPDDFVQLVSAQISFSDSYRDAISEAPRAVTIDPADSSIETDRDCVLRIARG